MTCNRNEEVSNLFHEPFLLCCNILQTLSSTPKVVRVQRNLLREGICFSSEDMDKWTVAHVMEDRTHPTTKQKILRLKYADEDEEDVLQGAVDRPERRTQTNPKLQSVAKKRTNMLTLKLVTIQRTTLLYHMYDNITQATTLMMEIHHQTMTSLKHRKHRGSVKNMQFKEHKGRNKQGCRAHA